MRILFIFLLGLITFQVNAQTKIIGATTTAGGDLQGTYPNPTIKSNIINRANLTASLRDSLSRIREDTSIIVGSGTTNYAASFKWVNQEGAGLINKTIQTQQSKAK